MTDDAGTQEGIMEEHEEAVAVDADEAGLTTAELLGNAALGVLALVAIWALHAAARRRHRRVDPRPAHRREALRSHARRGGSRRAVRRDRRIVARVPRARSRTCSSTCTPEARCATRSTKACAPRHLPGPTRACAKRAPCEVLDGLLRGRLGDDIRVECRPDGSTMVAHAEGSLPSWLPALVPSWRRDLRGADAARAMRHRTR